MVLVLTLVLVLVKFPTNLIENIKDFQIYNCELACCNLQLL